MDSKEQEFIERAEYHITRAQYQSAFISNTVNTFTGLYWRAYRVNRMEGHVIEARKYLNKLYRYRRYYKHSIDG